MPFSKEEILEFKNYCQKIIESPRPIDKQPHERRGKFIWCEDWEMIENLKYFFNGREAYFGDPPPNRLKNNPLWSKEDIADQAEEFILQFTTAKKIIESFEKERNSAYGA